MWPTPPVLLLAIILISGGLLSAPATAAKKWQRSTSAQVAFELLLSENKTQGVALRGWLARWAPERAAILCTRAGKAEQGFRVGIRPLAPRSRVPRGALHAAVRFLLGEDWGTPQQSGRWHTTYDGNAATIIVSTKNQGQEYKFRPILRRP